MLTLPLLIAFLKGVFLGSVFFYILWLSAKNLIRSAWPPSWFIGSWFIRMLIAIGGFYWVAEGDSMLLIACLCGFVTSKMVIARLVSINPSKPKKIPSNLNSKG